MSTAATRAPSDAKTAHASRPMPLPAPVISATLPSSLPVTAPPVEVPAIRDALEVALASVLERRGRIPATRSLTVDETRTSDGPAIPPTRAPMFTAIPPTFPSIVSTSPVWTPARTSRSSARTASTIACAQRTARAGPSKVAKNPSPAVSISTP